MARTDVLVLGGGIVGTTAALQLAKRGVSVALVDRKKPGEETSYGNAGIIESNTFFPYPFPFELGKLMRVALKLAPEANYHLSSLPKIASWLYAFAAASRPQKMLEFAQYMRPLYANSLIEHEKLIKDAGAERYLRHNGWLKVYRQDKNFDAAQSDLDVIAKAGLKFDILDQAKSLELEPDLAPIFKHGIFWPTAASITNPLGLTQAYIAQLTALGGVILQGDAMSLHRNGEHWRIETNQGPVDAAQAVIALGPWSQDILDRFDLKLPLAVKRGYHLHFRPRGNAGISRPILDADYGYLAAPMEQGIRLTTGAEFATRDAPATPVQFDRIMPAAREMFPIADQVEQEPWKGARPSLPDSMPVIGRAPGQKGLWLDYGHTHWGLTLSAVSGRLLAEMMTGATPFTDPTPYRAERFL